MVMILLRPCMRRRRERVPVADPGPTPGGAPVFISGCNRGGTTILAKLLGRHPNLCNIGEGHAFTEGQYIWRQRFPDTTRHRWAVEPWRRRMRKTEADATAERVEFFRTQFVAAASGRRFLEKTPANSVRIPFINA